MADKKISQLPKINLISGSEVILPIVHDGTTQKMDVSTFAVFASQWSATTGSNTFIGNQTVTGNTSIGGTLTVGGKITAQEIHTEITSASIIFESGSTIFGNTADDTHTITGTIILNGLSLGTPELMAQTASQAAVNLGISSVTGSINTTTSSFNSVFERISSTTGSINTTTSSFDSVFLGISSFTGSLNSISGSYATTGSNTFIGNQNITGSLSISAGEFNVTTGSGNMTSSLIFDHTQNDGVTLGLRHNDRLSFADHTFNVQAWAGGVYTTFVRNGTPYSVLNVEAFDNNKIYLYRDTRLYNKSLVIDNNLTVQKDVVIGTGSLSIERGQFSVTSGSGDLTSSISFKPVDYDLAQGASVFEVRHINNIYPEELALKLSVSDTSGTLFFEKNGSVYNVLSVGGNSNNLFISRNTRLLGTGLTVDDSLLVKGVITGSLLSTNGVVSSSNQLFELNAFTGSVIGQTNTISTFTSSANFATQSLNTQTGSQDLVNRGISSVTGSINTTTSSLIAITNGLMAFTAALDSTYATDAQLYQLYQATSSIHLTTQSLNVQTGSQDLINNQNAIVTSSFRAEIGGIESYTASLKSVAIVSSSTQISNYYKFAETASANTFYGNQKVKGNLDIDDKVSISGSLIVSTSINQLWATPEFQLYNGLGNVNFALTPKTGNQFTIQAYGTKAELLQANEPLRLLSPELQFVKYDNNPTLVSITGSVDVKSGGIKVRGNLDVDNKVSITGSLIVSSSANQLWATPEFQLYNGLGTVNLALTPNSGNQLQIQAYGTKAEITQANEPLRLLSPQLQFVKYDNTPTVVSVTGSIDVKTGGVTGSILATNGVVSSSQQIKDYYTFAQTSSANTFYGNQTITNGNLVVSSGQGIDFSATSNGSGTTTSELLNDYEEGSFTPVIAGGTTAGTATYTDQNGKYTKIGNCVHFRMDVIWSGHTGTGTLKITGLPFTIGQNYQSVGSVRFNQSGSANHYIAGGFIYQTQFELNQIPVGGGTPASFDITSVGDIRVSGHYFV